MIVVSHDGFNPGCRLEINHRSAHLHFRIAGEARPHPSSRFLGATGLPKASLAICHQVTTLDRAKLSKRIGALPLDVLSEVEEGLKAAIDLD